MKYQIECSDPAAHEFGVSLTFVAQGDECLELPSWIPGSYMVRNFAQHLHDLKAADEKGHAVALKKLDKQRWALNAQGEVTVTYRVYAFDLSVRTAFLDSTRGYFNGPAVFLRVASKQDEPHALTISRIKAAHWNVSTTLPEKKVDDRGFGDYLAANYEELIDNPVEIGEQQSGTFEVNGVPHEMAFTDADEIDLDRICTDVQKACAEHVAMFGELPTDRYLFMTLAIGEGFGGLEHKHCTSLISKRSDLPTKALKAQSDGYRNFIALCSHEYFHLWNVKRIKPEVLQQSDLLSEAHTQLLWAFEGITSYYDELGIVRCGAIERNDYLTMLASAMTRLSRTRGRERQSVAESSFDAWTKFYLQDANAPNVIVSYYNKGGLVSFGLDMWIRDVTQEQKTLDDVMRYLWQHYGRDEKGVPEDAFESVIENVAGTSPHEFFEQYIYGTAELPLDEWFAKVGVGLIRRTTGKTSDTGRCLPTPKDKTKSVIRLGARWAQADHGVPLTYVEKDSMAYRAGLSANDLLIAMNDEKLTCDNILGLLERHGVGAEVEVTYFRRDLLHTTKIRIEEGSANTIDVYWIADDQLDDAVKTRREAWLASSQ